MSGSLSLADEFFIKTICSRCAVTKLSHKISINWGSMISMRWSFTAKKSLCTACWSLSRAAARTEKPVHQWITKGSQTLHGDLDVQRRSLRLWAMQGPLESENEICCLTSLYWNPHFYRMLKIRDKQKPTAAVHEPAMNTIPENFCQWSHIRVYDSHIGITKSTGCVCLSVSVMCVCEQSEQGYAEL